MTKKAIDLESRTITFDFENGRETTVRLDELSEDMVTQLALHGLSQKLGDSYASAKAMTEDTDQTVEEYAESRVTTVFQELKDGNWTVRGSGEGGARVTDLAKAIAEVSGAPLEDVVAKLAEAEKEEKAGLRKIPQVAEVLARYRAERAAKKAEEEAKKAAGAEGPDLSAWLS